MIKQKIIVPLITTLGAVLALKAGEVFKEKLDKKT